MNQSKIENPLWAWFVLIGGGIFLLKVAPGMLITVAIPLWKPEVPILIIFVGYGILVGSTFIYSREFGIF
jgi:hypothetical protein